MAWLAHELSPSVTVSIMSQYSPQYRAGRVPRLSRRISAVEYETVLHALDEMGMENGWIQEMSAAEYYIPDFKREGHPFLGAPQRPG